jgi:hypothetical protein
MKIKKIALVASSILILWSCGNNKNPEQIKKEARLDSLEQIRIDSLAIVNAKQDSIAEITKFENEKEEYYETLALRKKYIGFKYEYPKSTDFISANGSPETLSGTDNSTWVVYFTKGDVTVVFNKKTNKFENICKGKNPSLKYDATAELSKLIGKRMTYENYTNKISSIRYGSIEKLGSKNCLNKDCVEYYSKGNFTTVAFFEFNDKGDFVTLKKIVSGKIARLNEY